MSMLSLVLLCLLFLSSGCTLIPQESTGPDGIPLLLQALPTTPAPLERNQGTAKQELPIVQVLMVDLRDTLHEVRRAIVGLENHLQRPRHCLDLLNGGESASGVRRVFPFRASPDVFADVYCDQETDGGGWTVFQRRLALPTREDFYRTWLEYKLGFGHMDGGEFWLGLDLLHHLTTHNLQELRVDLEDFDGNTTWAKYGLFHVGSAQTNYRLSIGRYNGTAGDSLTYHNNQSFSTHDADHDSYSSINCAENYRGAWWYKDCHQSNLNGFQYEGQMETRSDGINWYHFKDFKYSLRSTKMMVRPALKMFFTWK